MLREFIVLLDLLCYKIKSVAQHLFCWVISEAYFKIINFLFNNGSQLIVVEPAVPDSSELFLGTSD